jgi:hypothetical protein
MNNNGVFTSWEAFVKALQIRFGSLAYNGPMKALTRLKQLKIYQLSKPNLREYQTG